MNSNKAGQMVVRASYLTLLLILFVFVPCYFALAEPDKADNQVMATVDKDGVQRVEIVGGSYFFRPSHIVVKVNVPVELKVSKERGLVPHNIVMKSPDAGMDFAEDLGTTPKVVKFTPTKTGSFPVYCSKGGLFSTHREKGMEGVIEVVP